MSDSEFPTTAPGESPARPKREGDTAAASTTEPAKKTRTRKPAAKKRAASPKKPAGAAEPSQHPALSAPTPAPESRPHTEAPQTPRPPVSAAPVSHSESPVSSPPSPETSSAPPSGASQGHHPHQGRQNGGGDQPFERRDRKKRFRKNRKERWKEQREQRDRERERDYSVLENSPPVECAGLTEISPKGFGFLRQKERNYQQHPDDVFITPEVVRVHGLRDGLLVRCLAKQGVRGPQLTELLEINGRAPETYHNLPYFEELTAINPNKRLAL
ncbi:MAG: hypothetical protein KDM63_04905, partial [Verrucomicrobiae bacterium]|nr:hypothetical protein [Verrucomicrobiae bacterium]